MTDLRNRFSALLRQFVGDRRGVSAVEFAILLPLLLMILIVGNEVGQAVTIYRKVGHTAATLGDLTAQRQAVDLTALNNIFAASSAVMSPYPSSSASIVLSGATYSASKGYFVVNWSRTPTGAGWTVNTKPPITIPASLAVDQQGVVVATVSYTYTSPFSSFMKDIWGSASITLSDIAYLRPRVSPTVTCSNC